MTDRGNRLERALEVWLAYRADGEGDSGALLRAHPELRDFLELLLQRQAGEPTIDARLPESPLRSAALRRPMR